VLVDNRLKLVCNKSSECFVNRVLDLTSLLQQVSLKILQELVVKVVKEMLDVLELEFRS